MPKAILFDVDGTLIDTVELHAKAWVEALAHFGIPCALADMRLQIGKGGDQVLHGLMPPDDLERRGDEMKSYRSDLFKSKYMPQARAFPCVRELFQRIREDGTKIVLASSGKADEVARYKEIAGIADLIDGATSSDDAERSKPFPDIFTAALGSLGGIDPVDAMVVGDTPYDAEAARTARMPSVGVLCGGFAEEALRAAGCLAVYRDPQHLLQDYERSPLVRGLAVTERA